jgi:hypothetical protein
VLDYVGRYTHRVAIWGTATARKSSLGCRHLLGMPQVEKDNAESVTETDYLDRYEDFAGRSLRQCPQCRRGNMVVVRILARGPHPLRPSSTPHDTQR